MIILMKQLLEDGFEVAKQELTGSRAAQISQIFDFDTEVLVGTCSSDAHTVLELALFSRVSFALYQPDLKNIYPLLQQLKLAKYRQMSKLLYLSPRYFHDEMNLLEIIAEDFELVFEGDFQQICKNFVFDVHEREWNFYLGA